MEATSLIPVCSIPSAEQHRADNLADALEERGIEPTLLFDEADEGSFVVAVPQQQYRDALQVAESFLSNYETELDALISRQLRPSLSTRLQALLFVVFVPLALLWFSAHKLWKALFWEPGAGTYLSNWRDQDLGVGIIGLVVSVGYIVAISLLRKRICDTPR